MILKFDDLALRFKDYTDVKGKIRREVQSGRLSQVALAPLYKSTNLKLLAKLVKGGN